jgi:hypothetical protein
MEQGPRAKDRILGDEWLDWKGADEPPQITEGKRTFLFLSLVVLVGFVFLGILFWYLALPRFEQYGRLYATILTIVVLAGAAFFLVWYALLIGALVSQRIYLTVCLHRRSNLFIMLFPVVARLAQSFGISRDRLSHSFIEVSNRLVWPLRQDGPVLALVPRCLSKELKRQIGEICGGFPNVTLHTAPGGNEARAIIRRRGVRTRSRHGHQRRRPEDPSHRHSQHAPARAMQGHHARYREIPLCHSFLLHEILKPGGTVIE